VEELGYWRTLSDEEFHELYSMPNIIGVSYRGGCTHYSILAGKPGGKSHLENPDIDEIVSSGSGE